MSFEKNQPADEFVENTESGELTKEEADQAAGGRLPLHEQHQKHTGHFGGGAAHVDGSGSPPSSWRRSS